MRYLQACLLDNESILTSHLPFSPPDWSSSATPCPSLDQRHSLDRHLTNNRKPAFYISLSASPSETVLLDKIIEDESVCNMRVENVMYVVQISVRDTPSLSNYYFLAVLLEHVPLSVKL